jgi:hypothetical protein
MVRLEIHDRGTQEEMRWKVVATDEYGNATSGNPMVSLNAALGVVQWGRLGPPE